MKAKAALLLHQIAYEQRNFWRNRVAAGITLAFPLIGLGVTGAVVNNSGAGAHTASARSSAIAAILAFTVMSTAFNTTANTMVARRQLGQLKRLRGTPVPAAVVVLGVLASISLTIVGQAGLIVLLSPVIGAEIPRQPATAAAVVFLGAFAFGALALAATSSVTRMEVAGPVVGIGFLALLFLSGAMVQFPAGSLLAQATGWLPLRPFRTALNDALGSGAFDVRPLLLLTVWVAAAIAFAARRFRWIATG